LPPDLHKTWQNEEIFSMKTTVLAVAAILGMAVALPALADLNHSATLKESRQAQAGLLNVQDYRDRNDRGRDYRDRDRDRDDFRDRDRGWTSVGRESFEGRGDREASFPGFGGRNIDTIGLRPVNDDARCNRITATFANGQTRELGGRTLREDRITQVDLPGRDRNVTRIEMRCRAVSGRRVVVEVLTRG
jgi:hypothetical protein